MFRPRIHAPLTTVIATAASALLLLTAGCGGSGDELPRQPVSGKVTLDGQPLKAGMIQFEPAAGDVATAGGAAVVDGSFSIARAEGLVPGKYKVRITSAGAATALPPGAMPGDAPPPPKEKIPAKYNAKTELSADVTKGANDFDFKLGSK
jgi:hypothetical protein